MLMLAKPWIEINWGDFLNANPQISENMVIGIKSCTIEFYNSQDLGKTLECSLLLKLNSG